MNHRTNGRFWTHYRKLTPSLQRKADQAYALLASNPDHPSLRFKKVGRFWSARVTLEVRAVAIVDGPNLVWFWIGPHDEYERLLKGG